VADGRDDSVVAAGSGLADSRPGRASDLVDESSPHRSSTPSGDYVAPASPADLELLDVRSLACMSRQTPAAQPPPPSTTALPANSDQLRPQSVS